jgi:Pyruvate/2-oxoacid:ferredoxin oxidoreductase delta subunit
MSVRNIVNIDEGKCNGCGLCVTACAEGAIQLVGGKARLVSETYCDGLGACLGHCPQGAITLSQRESAEFDEHAVKEHLARQQKPAPAAAEGFVCPGMRQQSLRKPAASATAGTAPAASGAAASELTHWPIQLKLISPAAKCLQGADLLLVADCVPFAMGDFHARFLRDHSVVIGCPKLDDSEYYAEKLAEILLTAGLKSLTVIHMEVPCCSGLTRIAQRAIGQSGASMVFDDVTISLQGEVLHTETIQK